MRRPATRREIIWLFSCGPHKSIVMPDPKSSIRLARRRGLRSLSSLKCSIIGNGYTKRSAMSAPSSLKPRTLSPSEGVYGIGGSSAYVFIVGRSMPISQ